MEFLDVVRSTVNMIIQISWPFLFMTLTLGVGVGILQAASQIQEMTISFLPKLIGVVFLLFMLGPSIGYKMQTFVEHLFEKVILVGGR